MKNRKYPDKIQNKWGGDYSCKCYDTRSNDPESDVFGYEWCHDDYGDNIEWSQIDENHKLVCKGINIIVLN
jgi:hypothetical protein